MGLGGGDVGEHGRDNDPGYGGRDSSSNGGGNNKSRFSGNLSDVTKAMLHSPTAQEYNNYYASKLGVLGEPGAQWGDFTGAVNNIASGLYDRAKTGFLGLVDAPINFVNRLGANVPTVSPPQVRMAPLRAHDPNEQEQMRGYTDFGVQPPADVVQSLRDQYAVTHPDDWGFMDKVGVPAAARFTNKALTSTLNPLAAVAMLSANVPPEVLANPVTKQATGFLTGGLSQDIVDRAMFENTYDKIMGTGIYGGNPSYGIGQTMTETGENATGLNYRPKYQPEFTQGPSYGGYLRYGNYYG